MEDTTREILLLCAQAIAKAQRAVELRRKPISAPTQGPAQDSSKVRAL